jgi:hypothetical protein
MSGTMIFTQKCGVTDFLILSRRQHIPMLLIASYFSFQSCGECGTTAGTSGIGIVETTASAKTTPFGVRTPVTLLLFERI